MKKFLATLTVAISMIAMTACSSIESTKVQSDSIAARGDAVAVVQATNVGITAIFHFVPIVTSDLDTVVNKLLVQEAKALGGNKVELLAAFETPKSGIFALAGGIIGFPFATASGIAVK